jgi:hypothetical protein
MWKKHRNIPQKRDFIPAVWGFPRDNKNKKWIKTSGFRIIFWSIS